MKTFAGSGRIDRQPADGHARHRQTFQTYRHAGRIQPHHRPSLWQPVRHYTATTRSATTGAVRWHYPFTHHRASPARPLSPSAPCRPAWSLPPPRPHRAPRLTTLGPLQQHHPLQLSRPHSRH